MARLSSGRRFGGTFLILIGLGFIFAGIFTMFFTTNLIFDVISIFFPNVPTIIAIVGILMIVFGLFLIWAGRAIRNEPFLPNFITDMMR